MYPVQRLGRDGFWIIWPTREAMEIIVSQYKEAGKTLVQLASDFDVPETNLRHQLRVMGLKYGHIASTKYGLPLLDTILKEIAAEDITLIEWCRRNGHDNQVYRAVLKRLNRRGVVMRKSRVHGKEVCKKTFFTIEVPEEIGDNFKALFTLEGNPTNYLRNLIISMAENQELL